MLSSRLLLVVVGAPENVHRRYTDGAPSRAEVGGSDLAANDVVNGVMTP
jgi:hypothetical protein